MKNAPFKYVLVIGFGVMAIVGLLRVWEHFAFCNQRYDLINPARRCGDALPNGEWDFEYLRDTLSARKEELKASGNLSHLSIYFQDLDHGPRFGIGEYDKFHPASLMKVPILIFFLHAADLEQKILDKELSFTGELDVEDNIVAPEETVQPDTPTPIRELLRKMIVYSDNRSYRLLMQEMNALSEDVAYFTFRDLDVLQMMLQSDKTYVSISSYAKLFAVLYNTGYLSKEMSQMALQMLSDATFNEGIRAGVPEGVRVANKFGFVVMDGEGQLHDCGIVYHPQATYILCIMTSGQDQNKGNTAIVEISRMVYETISTLDFDP